MKIPKTIWFCRKTEEDTAIGDMIQEPSICGWYVGGDCALPLLWEKCNAKMVTLNETGLDISKR